MPGIVIRPATLADLPALTDIYNYYVVHTAITFDLQPFEPHGRRAWFDEHSPTGRHRLVVAVDEADATTVLGYATSGRWRARAAYDTTVETSVYCRNGSGGRGIGTLLYSALFQSLGAEDIHRLVAGVSLPNPASVALHERLGFQQVGVFSGVGRKFGRYWDVAWFQRPLKI